MYSIIIWIHLDLFGLAKPICRNAVAALFAQVYSSVKYFGLGNPATFYWTNLWYVFPFWDSCGELVSRTYTYLVRSKSIAAEHLYKAGCRRFLAQGRAPLSSSCFCAGYIRLLHPVSGFALPRFTIPTTRLDRLYLSILVNNNAKVYTRVMTRTCQLEKPSGRQCDFKPLKSSES